MGVELAVVQKHDLKYPDFKYDFTILDKDGYLLCYSSFYLGMTFSTYDQCFRAARKWIRDNQNLVYGENNV
jgi:hypothetical protein